MGKDIGRSYKYNQSKIPTRTLKKSVFKISDLFRISIQSSFSSRDYIKVCDKLVVYDVWFAEDDNTGFLSVGVGIFDRLYF